MFFNVSLFLFFKIYFNITVFNRIWLKLTLYFDKFVLFCKTLPQKIKDFLILSYRFFKKLLNQIVDTIKMYKYFIIIFSYIFITLTYCPYLDNIFQCRVVNDPFFFFILLYLVFLLKFICLIKNLKLNFLLPWTYLILI